MLAYGALASRNMLSWQLIEVYSPSSSRNSKFRISSTTMIRISVMAKLRPIIRGTVSLVRFGIPPAPDLGRHWSDRSGEKVEVVRSTTFQGKT